MDKNIIRLSELEGTKRLDAEYYQPEYLNTERKIQGCKHDKLKNLISILTDYHANGSYEVLRNNVKLLDKPDYALMLRTLNFVNDDFEYDVKYISKHAYDFLRKTQLFGYEIVINKIGEPGEVYIIPPLPNKMSLGMNLFMLRANNKLNEKYLYVYLTSSYGKKLLYRRVTGAVPLSIDKGSVRNVSVPMLSKKLQLQIDNLVEKHFKFRFKSKSLYSQAENLLLEELGLKDFKPRYKKTYTANLSDAFSVHRIDAEYFQPAYEEVVERIKKYPNGFSRLLEYVENVKPDFDPTKCPEKTFSYVELANIDASIGTIHSVNEIKGEEAPSRAKRILKDKDVVVSSVEGSLEKVALIDKEHNGCLASTGFFQFRPLDILPEVLLILSKTIVLQSQFKKKCSGTILTAVPKESLRDIIIPLLPLSTQQKIASLVQQSHEARKKAKELLEEAKKAVEIAIEKNEDEALDYLNKL